ALGRAAAGREAGVCLVDAERAAPFEAGAERGELGVQLEAREAECAQRVRAALGVLARARASEAREPAQGLAPRSQREGAVRTEGRAHPFAPRRPVWRRPPV